MIIKMPQINCFGFVIFNNNQTVLVQTKQGIYGFPKGKRNKGESELETAYRELREETGISPNDINVSPNIYFDEQKEGKKNISVRYFLAKLNNQVDLKIQDPDELANTFYININEALKLNNLSSIRKKILQNAFNTTS